MTESLTNVAERVCSEKWVTWWKPEYEAAVLEPYAYLTQTTGKEIRRKLIEAFNVWLKIPEEEEVINSVVSMLHSASLMIDDVEDDSRLRRGQPVVHKIYGIPQTINCANYVYFFAFKQLFKLRDQGPVIAEQEAQLDRLVTEELLNLHRGQGLDIFWRDNLICPSEEEYIDMVNNKTGGLFRIAIRLMMALSSSNIDCIALVNMFSVYFQIRDDYMNLQSSEYETHKGFAEDLTEGKFSFPIIHAVRANRTDRQVINVLQKRPSTPTLKHHAVDYMRDQTKLFEYTLNVLRNLEKEIWVEIDRMGRNGPLIAVLDALRL
ncbi:hypothetical protein M422DRAFT_60437 [Sphaerobolus stellatus SS14]|uniref:(2E,6E)-farnesyl diphosphate synthase n=1 Tax=Sphaerobolus stellatus (strain SS14) TaxID=990650 RepID=A0A0C9VIN9_SPHS4|nr:hypothetical protein M422DRAFT_60437 [Sphaerobolus stellatus SS14]